MLRFQSKGLTAVAMDSSRMFCRSDRILPRRIVQMLDPIFSLLSGQMPYSLGITLSASSLATYINQAVKNTIVLSTARLQGLFRLHIYLTMYT